MSAIIKLHHSIEENYSSLLAWKRQIELNCRNKTTKCMYCDNPLSAHLPDMRCSVYATSREFRGVDFDISQSIEKALDLLDELKGLPP